MRDGAGFSGRMPEGRTACDRVIDEDRMHRRDLILAVYLPTALLATAQGFLLATLPIFASHLNANYTIISLVVSGMALASLLTDLPAGLVLQRIGLKRAMVIGTGMVALSTAMLGL